jgi:uncharacterized protein
MSSEFISRETVYFTNAGKSNTAETLRLVKKRSDDLGIKNILIASTSGSTGLQAIKIFKGCKIIVVSHAAGLKEPDMQEFDLAARKKIESAGGVVLTATHAFAGVARAVRIQLNTYEVPEIMAYTLRIFGQGMKVACEITLMVADSGLLRTDEDVIAIGGTGVGADTAIVIKPVNTQNFFDIKVREIICKPR